MSYKMSHLVENNYEVTDSRQKKLRQYTKNFKKKKSKKREDELKGHIVNTYITYI